MNIRIIYFIVWGLLLNCKLAFCQQNYSVTKIPSELVQLADATVRDEHVSVTMKSAKHVETKIFKVITIHNERGQNFADLNLYYNQSRKIKKIQGQILNGAGVQVSKFTLKDFNDQSASGESNLYDDTRVKTFSPRHTYYPYTLIYTLDFIDDQNLSIPQWSPDYPADLAVENSQYSFTFPSTEKIRIDAQNYIGAPKTQEDGKTTTHTWSIKNKAAARSEPLSPPRHLVATSVRIVPKSFQYYKKTGTFTNWEEFGKWQYDVLLSDKRQLPEATILKVQGLIKNVNSPKEKAKILYHYLQNKTRYISIQIGIGGLNPFPAETVDRLGYGDCKALVNYMQALLDIAQIESYYCIVEAGIIKKDISKDFANVSDGNHIILCIPFENDTTWLECTSQKIPFGYLSNFTDDRLVIASSAAGGKLMRTPKFKDEESLQIRKSSFKVLQDGSLEGQINTRFFGGQLDNHFYNSFVSEKEQKLNLHRWYNVDNIDFKNLTYTTNFDDSLLVSENLEVFIKNYGVISGKQLILHPNIFVKASVVPANRNRQNSLFISRGYSDIDITEFELPENWNLNLLPYFKEINTAMGSYLSTVTFKDRIMTWTRKLVVRSGEYPKENYMDWYTFMHEVRSADQIKYTIRALL